MYLSKEGSPTRPVSIHLIGHMVWDGRARAGGPVLARGGVVVAGAQACGHLLLVPLLRLRPITPGEGRVPLPFGDDVLLPELFEFFNRKIVPIGGIHLDAEN
jgi:hypothetical protein